MSRFASWLSSLRRAPGSRPVRRRRRGFRPGLELLEGREVPTVFTVTNTLDAGAGSLRESILLANNTPNVGGPDEIRFNIPGAGVHTIAPASELPEITEALIIDGFTQPGASPNTQGIGDDSVHLIEINGAGAGAGVNGLTINTSGSTIRGLVINGFRQDAQLNDGNGIFLLDEPGNTDNVFEGNFLGTDPAGTTAVPNEGAGIFGGGFFTTGTRIGGLTPGQRNVISGNAGDGIHMFTFNSVVQGNYVGVNAADTAALGNGGDGVAILGAEGTSVGGDQEGSGNVIAGNGGDGVKLDSSRQCLVQGNLIGTDEAETAKRGNGGFRVAITGNATDNLLRDNVIVDNGAGGVLLEGKSDGEGGFFAPSDNRLEENFIGTTAGGTGDLGNGGPGVLIGLAAADNTVGGTTIGTANFIAHNADTGVGLTLDASTGNSILGNSIFANGQLGIDLGQNDVTPNDKADPDAGPNNFQNAPVIVSVVAGANGSVI